MHFATLNVLLEVAALKQVGKLLATLFLCPQSAANQISSFSLDWNDYDVMRSVIVDFTRCAIIGTLTKLRLKCMY